LKDGSPRATIGADLGVKAMRSARGIRGALICAVAFWATAASAQGNDPGRSDWLYDPGTVETLSGEVTRVDKVPSASGRRWMRLILRTDTGDSVPVALGPAWVVDRQALSIRSGDRIDVTGWRVVRSKPALVAAEVRKGDATLRLRDAYGAALWANPDDACPESESTCDAHGDVEVGG
jgi:hypothetical protein